MTHVQSSVLHASAVSALIALGGCGANTVATVKPLNVEHYIDTIAASAPKYAADLAKVASCVPGTAAPKGHIHWSCTVTLGPKAPQTLWSVFGKPGKRTVVTVDTTPKGAWAAIAPSGRAYIAGCCIRGNT